MALAVWCGLVHAAPPVATQLPTGGQVVAGQATISQAGQSAVLNVNQTSASAVINWNTFNLGSAASVNFAQPDRNAAVLNRVLDANPSQIYGRISAPGQVFFSNPNGMYFAPTASVDVGGLVATTHSISTADFMAGNYRFTRDGATGAIVNEGQLQATLGGYVALLAPEVRNHGVVLAQMGAVALAAGESYQLQIQGSRLSQIDVTPATIRTLVENGQAVLAPEGWIVLSAKAAQQLEASVVNTG
jgi:filamentous hemagglutinin family protein